MGRDAGALCLEVPERAVQRAAGAAVRTQRLQLLPGQACFDPRPQRLKLAYDRFWRLAFIGDSMPACSGPVWAEVAIGPKNVGMRT